MNAEGGSPSHTPVKPAGAVKETKVVLDNALTFMAYGHDTSGHLKRGALAPLLEWTVERHVNARKKRKSVV
jgi:hypothetical protein